MLNGTTEFTLELEEPDCPMAWKGGGDAVLLRLFGERLAGGGGPARRLFVWDERLHASLQEGGMKALAP